MYICTHRYGPIVHLWSMRFEGKHKEFKTIARGNCYKNILKTLVLNHQRNLAYNLSLNHHFASVSLSTGASMFPTIFINCKSIISLLSCSEGGYFSL